MRLRVSRMSSQSGGRFVIVDRYIRPVNQRFWLPIEGFRQLCYSRRPIRLIPAPYRTYEVMDTTYGYDRSEHDLLKAVAGGDLASFERLYRLYATRVLHYARTLVHDQAIAEEILGDVMFAIWRGAGTFTGTARVS